MRYFYIIMMLCLSIHTSAQSKHPEHKALTDQEKILKARDAFNTAIAKHDASLIADFFTSDYIINYGSSRKVTDDFMKFIPLSNLYAQTQ